MESYLLAFRGREILLTETMAPPRGGDFPGLAPEQPPLAGHWQGIPCYCAAWPVERDVPPGFLLQPLRQLYGVLPDALVGLAGRAAQIVDWDRTHRFCGACATPTERHAIDHVRTCPRCGLQFWPRLSPAVIVAVERGDEILLGRGAHFPPGIYSVLAGFVEAGESAEAATIREVREESGIEIGNLRYFGSQPWPFPNSLMIAFQADYAGGSVTPDPKELEDAGFFKASAMPGTFAGSASISQWLVRDFLRRNKAL